MSSDSGESNSSAHRNNQEESTYDDGALPVDGKTTTAEGANGAVDQDDVGEELESLDNGTIGLTFARVRSRGGEQEEAETTSELSFRPRIERPGSPESTSTPDDTPSIQVGCLSTNDFLPLTPTRAPDCLLQAVVFLCRIALFALTDQLHCSPSSVASHRDYHLLHWLRLAHRPRHFYQRTPDNPRYQAICSFRRNPMRQKHHKRHGKLFDGPS